MYGARPRPKTNLMKITIGCLIAAMALSAAVHIAPATAVDAASARVERIASVLELATGIKARVLVVPDAARDACVMPDGTIVITNGLVAACATDDEAAFVIAHELAHVAALDHRGASSAPALYTGADRPEYQFREINADINAVYYTGKAGYDRAAGESILKRLAPDPNPTFDNRLRTLSTYLSTLGPVNR
ncbi:MAG: M48 family metalloprotease [Deltaproteobacteria bacterium]|nr:M48 family metalloprotease [Deltaproteobacteria bacterium]